jgi:hypothetical protein
MASLLRFIFLLAVLVAPATPICYYPDGSVAPQDVPCTDLTTQASCCGQGYACLGLPSNFFLCEATGDEIKKPGASRYVRGSCTDKTWRSSNCPSVCVDPSKDNLAGGEGVAECANSDTLFYCIDAGQSSVNCDNETNVLIFVGK